MKKALLITGISLICAFTSRAETLEAVSSEAYIAATPEVSAKTGYVLMILPQYNFVDDEYSITKVILSRGGYTVEVASTSTREIALGADIIKVRPKLTINDIDTDRYDGAVFVGGYMSKKFFEDKGLIEKARQLALKGKLIGAMDNVPYFMAQWGLLKDKKTTVNPSLAKAIKNMGINYIEKDIVFDKNYISVNKVMYSDQFAQEFLAELNKR